jgi:hypothetical protein
VIDVGGIISAADARNGAAPSATCAWVSPGFLLHPLDPASEAEDAYSFGCIIYNLATCKAPMLGLDVGDSVCVSVSVCPCVYVCVLVCT